MIVHKCDICGEEHGTEGMIDGIYKTNLPEIMFKEYGNYPSHDIKYIKYKVRKTLEIYAEEKNEWYTVKKDLCVKCVKKLEM